MTPLEARFEALMRQYETDVLRVCYLQLKNQALAEDATQDTFLKVWRSLEQFERRNHASEKTWIIRIAINTCKNYRRMPWHRHALLLPPPDAPAPQTDISLLQSVLDLPNDIKDAIILCYYEQFTVPEAAQALHVTRQTLYRRLKKGYALLRMTEEEFT